MEIQDALKNAAASHIDRPRSAREEILDIASARRKSPSRACLLARANDQWENQTGRRVDSLDKDNVLTDHPEKYGLEKASGDSALPPEELLAIPGSYVAEVTKNTRLTPLDHWQDTRLLEFALHEGTQLANQLKNQPVIGPGSTVVLYPKNFPKDVQVLIDLMEWDSVADKPLEWSSSRPSQNKENLQVPYRARPKKLHTLQKHPSLRHLLTHHIDITAVPKRNFIRELTYFTKDEREKDRLKELTKMGDQEEFYDYTARPRRTIIEVLQDFQGVKIPWQRCLDLFPIIRGREYSISNGRNMLEGDVFRIELLVALVEYKTIIRKPRQGLCSRYVKYLVPGTLLTVTFKNVMRKNVLGDMVMEGTSNPCLIEQIEHIERPLIAIATGTGIAPVRALIQYRHRLYEDDLVSKSDFANGFVPSIDSNISGPGPVLLFYGCRNKNADFYFQDEWEKLEGIGLFEVHGAFSRDPVLPKDEKILDPYGDTRFGLAKVEIPEPQGSPTTPDSEEEDPLGGTQKTDREKLEGQEDAYYPILDKPRTMDAPNQFNTGLAVYDYDRGRDYVQHRIRQQYAAIGKLARQNPIVMVCGNSGRMPKSVWNALRDSLVMSSVVETREEADGWLKDPNNLMFWQETW
jgi:sulfite reductase alpha subunit-like flavoprotein